MKKTILSILLFSIWFFGFTFADLEFTNYQILGQIENDGTINVQEKIDVHFFDKMHGIERSLPNFYTVGDSEFQVFINNINVPDYKYTTSNYYSETDLRIWDANIYVTWNKKYEIDYSIYWLIKNFSGLWYSELYRNVIWYDGLNDVNNVQIELTLPKAYTWLTKDDFMIVAWHSDKTGLDDFLWEVKRDENKIYITYNQKLPPHNWITLAIKFPNNYFEFDHEKQEQLFVWYTRNFNIENYKLSWTVEKSGNIIFENNIQLEILNKNPSILANLPYRYDVNYDSYLLQLKNVEINWKKINNKTYDTSNTYSSFYITWESNISWNYSVYWFVRPFTGEFEDRAYRLYLPLPILNLSENVKNLEIMLDVPWWCEKIYKEDVYVKIWLLTIWLDKFNEWYGKIWCHDNKLAMIYSWEIESYSNITLIVNFVKWTFDLDEDLLEAMAKVWDWQFYYTDKTNRQSIVFAIWMLLFGWWFKALMNKRYTKKARKSEKYPIQYDAPKWVDVTEAWVLVDNRIDPKDITALIYHRAANHYIKILKEDHNERKFYIKKLKRLPWNSKKYQLNLFNSLFKEQDEFHFSKEYTKLNKYLATAQKELKQYITSEKRYKWTFFSGIWSSFKSQNAALVFRTAILWFIPYFWVITALTEHLTPVSNWTKMICFISFILIVTSYRNYKEETNTKKWQEARNHCLWFKDFLMKVDKIKLETLLKEDPLYVEKALPFAIAFWVESEFIKQITPDMIKDLDLIDWDLYNLTKSIRFFHRYNSTSFYISTSSGWHSSSYSSSWWFSSWSSFGWWFSSWWGWGWWWFGWW